MDQAVSPAVEDAVTAELVATRGGEGAPQHPIAATVGRVDVIRLDARREEWAAPVILPPERRVSACVKEGARSKVDLLPLLARVCDARQADALARPRRVERNKLAAVVVAGGRVEGLPLERLRAPRLRRAHVERRRRRRLSAQPKLHVCVRRPRRRVAPRRDVERPARTIEPQPDERCAEDVGVVVEEHDRLKVDLIQRVELQPVQRDHHHTHKLDVARAGEQRHKADTVATEKGQLTPAERVLPHDNGRSLGERAQRTEEGRRRTGQGVKDARAVRGLLRRERSRPGEERAAEGAPGGRPRRWQARARAAAPSARRQNGMSDRAAEAKRAEATQRHGGGGDGLRRQCVVGACRTESLGDERVEHSQLRVAHRGGICEQSLQLQQADLPRSRLTMPDAGLGRADGKGARAVAMHCCQRSHLGRVAKCRARAVRLHAHDIEGRERSARERSQQQRALS